MTIFFVIGYLNYAHWRRGWCGERCEYHLRMFPSFSHAYSRCLSSWSVLDFCQAVDILGGMAPNVARPSRDVSGLLSYSRIAPESLRTLEDFLES